MMENERFASKEPPAVSHTKNFVDEQLNYGEMQRKPRLKPINSPSFNNLSKKKVPSLTANPSHK